MDSLKLQKVILSVLEARIPKSRWCQLMAPSGGSEEETIPALFLAFWQLSAVLVVPWLWQCSSNLCLHCHMAFSLYICLCFFSSYKDTSHITIRAHPNPVWPLLNLITFTKTLMFTVLGVKTSTCLSGGHNSVYSTYQSGCPLFL